MSEETQESGLRPAQERALDRLMDRVEDRLWGASEGAHRVHPGAGWAEVQAIGIGPEPGYFWTRFNGLELAQGEVEVAQLEQIPEWTKCFAERLAPGDLVVGQRGRDLYVVPKDPWAEGAMVVLVDEFGQRGPLASSVGHWVLSLLGEFALLFDEDGEYRDELFDAQDGQLQPSVRRKILRRRLDMDPDGVLPRFELGQLLREQGEHRAAITELRRAIKGAPDFAWSHYELGRCYWALGQGHPAKRAFEQAADLAREDPNRFALFAAWVIVAIADPQDEEAQALRQQILQRAPAFASDQLEQATELYEEDCPELIAEHLELGLAVAPRDLGLLAMRQRLTQQTQEPPEA